MNDLRYATRALAKSPGFTSVAVLSLALGIGANTAVYSAIRTVLFDTLPVKAPEDLVELAWTHSSAGRSTGITTMGSSGFRDEKTGKSYSSNFSYSLFRAFQDTAGESAELFAFSYAVGDVSVSFGNQALVGSSLLVSGNYFSTIGVRTVLGRPLNDDDDTHGAQPAAVISHSLWVRAFGSDRNVLGRSIRLNGAPFTIVGVTTPAFFGMSKGGFFPPSEVFMPLAAHPLVYTRAAPERRSLFAADDRWWLRVMARTQPGASTPQLEAELNATFHQSLAASAVPELRNTRSWEVRLFPAAKGVDVLTRGLRAPLLILGAVVGIVLLIACVNVGNLMLARGVARQKEMSIRLALGASRWRLSRGILIESALLAIVGAVFGTMLGVWGGRALLTTLAAGAGRTALSVSIDGHLLGAVAGASCLAALIFALMPALRTARRDVAPALKQVASGSNARGLTAGTILMVVQVAISVPLLVGSGLFLRTVYNLANVDLGFDPERLLIFRLDPTLNGYESNRIVGFYDQILQRVRTIPGVTSATLSDVVLLSRVQNNWRFSVNGSEPRNVKFARVGPVFFDTIGIPIVAGRGISVQDHSDAPPVAVVNESAARTLFDSSPAIGRRITMRSDPPVTFDVVGVVKDSRYTSPRDPIPATIYLPYAQTTLGQFGPMNVIVRSAGPAGSLAGPIRAAVADVERDVPVIEMKTQSEQIDQTLGTELTLMRLLVAFGAFALLLASIGLHGVTTYSVTRRTSEIGVRVALGAQRGDVLRLILRQVVMITLAGLALGVPAALAGSRIIRAMLYGVYPADPLSLAGAAGVMAAVASVAAFGPARRAARLDPLVALRHE